MAATNNENEKLPAPHDQGDLSEHEGQIEEQKDISTWLEQYHNLIDDYVFVPNNNPNHLYINYNIVGKQLTKELIMSHLHDIYEANNRKGIKLYVQPQLGFFLYNSIGNKIEKYFYNSSNTSIFPTYRLLSYRTFKKLENYVSTLYVKDFPSQMKQVAMERSTLGFTLITNIVYSVIIV